LEPFIEIRNLEKVYTSGKSTVCALKNLSLDVYHNEFLSIIGQSGCGKSTLLKIIAGLLPKTSGSLKIKGVEVKGPPPDIGFVFQNPALYPWRTTLRNIMFPAEILCLDKEKCHEKAIELIDLAGIKGFEHSLPYELSGGMQSRVSLCRALIHDPSLLLMDEPFGALDAMTRDMMAEELQRIWQQLKKTVVFVTHSISEAVFLSDRVLIMTPRPGQIKSTIQIDLPRPRTLTTKTSPKYTQYILQIEKEIGRTL